MSVLERFKLNDRVAIVTGGVGLFGRQIVEALAEAKAKVVVTSRDVGSIESVCERWRTRGLSIYPESMDLTQEDSIQNLHDRVLARHGQVDILVNNAVMRPMADWSDPSDTFAKSMSANATGLFMITRLFGEHMAHRKRGSIINIGSIQGMVGPDFTLYEGLGWGTCPDYFFHKGGMIQLTRFAAAKLGPNGVRVNCVSPGGFMNDQDPVFVDRYNDRTFMGRLANDDDLRGTIVFLASDASAYITGTNIPVDGGYTAK